MTSIGGIGWSPRLGSEKSHDVHGWIVVYQKLSVLGWRIHTGCPRLEALTGRGVCAWYIHRYTREIPDFVYRPLSAMGLKLGYSGFYPPHMQK